MRAGQDQLGRASAPAGPAFMAGPAAPHKGGSRAAKAAQLVWATRIRLRAPARDAAS